MESPPRKRRRPALSCLECRRRKIKCDRNEPCAHCVASRSQCTFKVYRHDPVVAPQPLLTPSASLGAATANAPTPVSQPSLTDANTCTDNQAPTRQFNPYTAPRVATATAAVRGHHDTLKIASRSYNLPQREAQDAENIQAVLQDPLQLVQSPETSAAGLGRRRPESGQGILERQPGIQDSHVILKKTRVLNWSDWIGQTQEFEPIFSCYAAAYGDENVGGDSFRDPEIRSLHVQIGDLVQKCKAIAKRMKMGRPSRNLLYAEFNLEPPSWEVAETMANLYFQSFESTYRILHVPSFWADYRKYQNDPGSVTLGLRLQILLVIGIGSGLHEHGDMDIEFRNKVHQWVYAAQTWLSGPIEKDRLNITGLQVHCLTLLARQVFSIGSDLVWMSVGSLVHSAMQIGLHRDPKHLPPMSILQDEIRRRLWTTILEMVVQMSLDAAMPPRISFDEFDTEAPSNINDDDIDASTTELHPHPKSTFTGTSMQLLLFDSLPTRLRIVRLISGLHSELSYMDVLSLSSEITNACRSWSKFLKENESAGVTAFHRNLLDYLVRRFLIPLHCTFASKARANPLFYYSLKVSLETALAIVSPEPDEGYSHLELIGGGMFREGIRCTVTVISTELVAQTAAQRLDGTLHRNDQYREVLKQVLRGRIALSVERIRQGETNIKTHMFLNMILAQVEAMEEGSPCDLKIARSAKASLELCYSLLQERADSLSFPVSNDLGLSPPNFNGGLGFDMNFDLDFFLRDEGFS
ncbi:hypothetical protein GGR53DRAFT_418680 [Hypoxylon sp. FL1150]|nr:hypothetical protein GGR53DRAFT_418680 [Hypoxylon sp. FL1150]